MKYRTSIHYSDGARLNHRHAASAYVCKCITTHSQHSYYITLHFHSHHKRGLLHYPYPTATPQLRSPARLCPVCLALVLFQVPCCRSIPEHPMLFSTALALTQMPCLTLPCPSRPLYCTTYSLLPDQQPKIITNSVLRCSRSHAAGGGDNIALSQSQDENEFSSSSVHLLAWLSDSSLLASIMQSRVQREKSRQNT
ncbi:3-oxoadipate enol-lactonase 2 [Fusarium oxysporum f. sp. albedinis]|nr:3-oxoadipate enol-lactonase 2 [Fusarium oxysporum f. sp. albedinis]